MPANEKRKFSIPLPAEKQLEIGNKLADINIEIEKKLDLKRTLPKNIESLQEYAAELGHKLKDGTESQEVDCFWVVDDPKPGLASLYRYDNSEKVDERAMNLFDVEDEQPEAGTPQEVLELEPHTDYEVVSDVEDNNATE